MADSKELTALKRASENFLEEIRKDPIKLKKFLRQVNGPERRTLSEQERDQMLIIFGLIDPVESSNNQRSWTDVYEHAGKIYHAHYVEFETIIEEILPDDIQ